MNAAGRYITVDVHCSNLTKSEIGSMQRSVLEVQNRMHGRRMMHLVLWESAARSADTPIRPACDLPVQRPSLLSAFCAPDSIAHSCRCDRIDRPLRLLVNKTAHPDQMQQIVARMREREQNETRYPSASPTTATPTPAPVPHARATAVPNYVAPPATPTRVPTWDWQRHAPTDDASWPTLGSERRVIARVMRSRSRPYWVHQ